MKEQHIKTLDDIEPGDVVRGKESGDGYIVTANYGDYAIAVRTVMIRRPNEWLLIKKNKLNL